MIFTMIDKMFEIQGSNLLLLAILCSLVSVMLIILMILGLVSDKKIKTEKKALTDEAEYYQKRYEKSVEVNTLVDGIVSALEKGKPLPEIEGYVYKPKNASKKDTRQYDQCLAELPKVKRQIIEEFTKACNELEGISSKKAGRKLTYKLGKSTIADITIKFDTAVIKIYVQNKELLDREMVLKPLSFDVTKYLNVDNLILAVKQAHIVFALEANK